jgi:hypothetical protein
MNNLTVKLLVFMLLALAGCAKVDASCIWEFNVVNKTTSDIIVVKGTSQEIITPEQTRVIHEVWVLCGENEKIGEIYIDDEAGRMLPFVLKTNDQTISSDIFKREYWTFSGKGRLGTYTLTVTTELIESVGYDKI